MALPLVELHICGQRQNRTAQAELTAGFGQQPAQLDGGLLQELGRFGATSVGEQIQRSDISPAPEHQGSHPWGAISGDGGELQPAGCW